VCALLHLYRLRRVDMQLYGAMTTNVGTSINQQNSGLLIDNTSVYLLIDTK
jgi:hypothetical protein